MFDLTLTPEQIEMRDTLHDFAQSEMKAAAIHPDRLQPFEKPVMTDLLTKAAQLGIRTLALSEEAGGAGADNLTTCIVLEELASGEVDVATILGTTATLGRSLFDTLMTAEQKAKYLKAFVEDDSYHLAFAGTTAVSTAVTGFHDAKVNVSLPRAFGLAVRRSGPRSAP